MGGTIQLTQVLLVWRRAEKITSLFFVLICGSLCFKISVTYLLEILALEGGLGGRYLVFIKKITTLSCFSITLDPMCPSPSALFINVLQEISKGKLTWEKRRNLMRGEVQNTRGGFCFRLFLPCALEWAQAVQADRLPCSAIHCGPSLVQPQMFPADVHFIVSW